VHIVWCITKKPFTTPYRLLVVGEYVGCVGTRVLFLTWDTTTEIQMKYGITRMAILGGAAIAGLACADMTNSGSSVSLAALSASLSTVPLGYGDLSSSYVGAPLDSKESAGFWLGGGRDAGFDRGGLMGGGLQDAFAGAIPFTRRDGGHGPFAGGLPCTAPVNATTGFITCTDTARNGVTITRAAKYTTAAGAVQSAFDTLTTNTVVIQMTANGSITYDTASDNDRGPDRERHWGRGRGPGGRLLGDTSTILTAKTTLTSTSTRTTSGLASGSTQRTVNGASAGNETTTGTSSLGSFFASRTVGDTTSGLVIPVAVGTVSYPSAGSVIRSMTASIQYAGQTAVSLARREVITYDGSATAKVVITENGTTKSCTRPLPRGPLTCS
jgi:hypothetical protein